MNDFPVDDEASDVFRGLLNGCLLSIPMWAAIIMAVRWALR